MKTPLLGAAYVARSVNAADNRMVNLFPEVIPEGGKEKGWLQRTPGLRRVLTAGTGPIRGLWSFGGAAYAVSGTKLYRLTGAGAVSELGTVTGSGPVSMADNGTQLFVAADPASFIYNSTTGVFAQVVDADFAGAKMVGYLDGYFVFIESTGQRVWVTELLDGTAVDPLDFASAEGSPDNLVSMIVDHREVWLFGTESTEVWVNAGGADFPLERINGAFNEVGCAATYSVARADNSIFWLGADDRGRGVVYRANGYTAVRVSTHAVEWQIQSYGDISGAVAYTYQQDGHTFYVITFPTSGVSWAYDVATNAWHERLGFHNGEFARHRAASQTAFNNEVWVGDYEDGRVYALDLTVYQDDDRLQKWYRSWRALPTGTNTLQRTAHHELQLDCQAGVGLNGIDTSVVLVDIELLTEAGDEILTETPSAALSVWEATTPPSAFIENAASNGVRILTANSAGQVHSSDNAGASWTLRFTTAFSGQTLSAGNGLLFFITAGGLYVSSDNGVTWSFDASFSGGGWILHAFGAGVHVITSSSGTSIRTSTNGTTWVTRTTFPLVVGAVGLAFGGDRFVAVTGSGGSAWSLDGITWNVVALALFNARTVSYGGGLFLVSQTAAPTTDYMISTDATSWTLQALPASEVWWLPVYGHGKWMLTTITGTSSYVSDTGLTGSWTARAYANALTWLEHVFASSYFLIITNATPSNADRYFVPLPAEPQNILVDQTQTQGVIPKVMLRWSDDGGHTWSNEHWREIGRQGEYGNRVIWRRLGMTLKLRDRVYEVSGTDPVKIALMGAELDVSPTRG